MNFIYATSYKRSKPLLFSDLLLRCEALKGEFSQIDGTLPQAERSSKYFVESQIIFAINH